MKQLVILFIASFTFLFGGEPLLNPGQYQVRFDYLSLSASDLYDTFKEKQPIEVNGQDQDYDLTASHIRLRYGATSYTTLVLAGTWKDHALKGGDENYSQDGLESYFVGVQVRRDAGRFHSFVWSIGFRGDGSYDDEEPMPLASGEESWEVSGNYLFSLNPYHAYFNFDLGYRFNGGSVADEWVVHASWTYQMKGRTEFRLFYDALESADTKREAFDPLFYPNERGSQKTGVAVSVGLGRRLSLFASYEQVINGRNIFETDGFRTGISYLFP